MDLPRPLEDATYIVYNLALRVATKLLCLKSLHLGYRVNCSSSVTLVFTDRFEYNSVKEMNYASLILGIIFVFK